jgi:hypothetical protein
MSLISTVVSLVFAAETIISPFPGYMQFVDSSPNKPAVSFSELKGPTPTPKARALTPAALPSLTVPLLTPAPTSKTATHKPQKARYTIALLGDSMIDTLGPDVPHLKSKLMKTYPGVTFTMLNFGVGATNIDYGIERLTNPYLYLGNPMPSLLSQKPDIVVVESFGYNPYSIDTGAIDRHWLSLADIVHRIKEQLPGTKIVIASTIAPNSRVFGDGAPGLSFDDNEKRQRTETIKKYLESTVRFARSEKLPLADIYHASVDKFGEGKLMYINSGDHIHYSDAGRELFAQKVTATIINNHLLD